MAKWETAKAEGGVDFAGGYRTVVVREFTNLGAGVPFDRGEILSFEAWTRLRAQIDAFYTRVRDEGRALVEGGRRVDVIRHINDLRLAGLRRVPETAPGGGYVYFLRGDGYCKIGQTTSLQQRLNTLKIQLPFKVDLFHAIPTATPVSLEQQFHKKFADKRANGEWFKLEEEDFAHIKQWNRAYTVVDCAIECSADMSAVALARLINSRSILVEHRADWVLQVVDNCLDWDAELVARVNAQLERHHEAICEILSANTCESCGAEVRYSEVYYDLPDPESAETAGADSKEDIPF